MIATPQELDEQALLEQLLEVIQKQAESNGPLQDEASEFMGAFVVVARSYFHGVQVYLNGEAAKDLPQLALARKIIISKTITRLFDEWKRVKPIIEHLISPHGDKQLKQHIDEVVKVARATLTAAPDVDVQVEIDIIPSFGTSFYLLRAPYFPHKALLSIPIYALPFAEAQMILWHELAGLTVSQASQAFLPQNIAASYLPHQLFSRLPLPTPQIDWTTVQTHGEPSDADYTTAKQAFTVDDPNGGWDIFWMYWADKLNPRWRNLAMHAQPKAEDYPFKRDYLIDWRLAHLEELAEDACSTLVFGAATYHALYEVMINHYPDLDSPDIRHPAPHLRLDVTYYLLHLMGEGDTLGDDPIAHLHGQAPGAQALAAWIYSNRDQLIRPGNDVQAIRDQLRTAGQQLEASFRDNRAQLKSEWLAARAKVTEATRATDMDELEWRLFASIDPNAGTSSASKTVGQAVTQIVQKLRDALKG